MTKTPYGNFDTSSYEAKESSKMATRARIVLDASFLIVSKLPDVVIKETTPFERHMLALKAIEIAKGGNPVI